MKFYLHLILLFLFGESFSQNYKTVLPDTATFFINESGYIRAIRIDTVYLEGTDTIYKNFHTVREDTVNCSDTQSGYGGLNPFGASWLGEKVIIKPDGGNIYFNKNGDSIFIRTHAALGESWRLFELDSGNYLEAVVSDISYDTILGIADSMKSISIQAKDSMGNLVSNSFNSKQIRLSKYRGVIRTVHFYEFPLDTSTYNLIDKGILTWREVYDFEVGDKIQVYTSKLSYPILYQTYSLNHYLSKYFSINQDTVFYKTELKTDSIHFHTNLNRIIYEKHIRDTVLLFYSNLDKSIIDALPDMAYSSNYDLWSYSMHYIDTICDGSKVVISGNYNHYEQNDSCWIPSIDGLIYKMKYIEGIGLLQNTIAIGGSTSQRIVFYQKGSCSFGQLFTTTSPFEFVEESFSIYPNPASNEILIKVHQPEFPETFISVVDLIGRTVYSSGLFQQSLLKISTHDWSSGFYLVTINSDGYSTTKKIVIQK